MSMYYDHYSGIVRIIHTTRPDNHILYEGRSSPHREVVVEDIDFTSVGRLESSHDWDRLDQLSRQ